MQWSRWGWRWGSSSTESRIFHQVKSHCVFVKVGKNWANALTMRIQKSHPMHCDVQHMHLDGATTRGKDQNVFLSLLTIVNLHIPLSLLQNVKTICEKIGWLDFAESIRARPNWTEHIIESTTSCFVRNTFHKWRSKKIFSKNFSLTDQFRIGVCMWTAARQQEQGPQSKNASRITPPSASCFKEVSN